METLTKTCIKCKREKVLSEFSFNTARSKHISTCKPCVSLKTKEWQKKLYTSTSEKDLLETTFYKISQSSHSNARSRNIPYLLSLQDLRTLYNKQNGKCFYTGVVMALKAGSTNDCHPLHISLDRIDSSRGYIVGNVVFCCWGVNALKGKHSIEMFYNHLKLFYESSKENKKI